MTKSDDSVGNDKTNLPINSECTTKFYPHVTPHREAPGTVSLVFRKDKTSAYFLSKISFSRYSLTYQTPRKLLDYILRLVFLQTSARFGIFGTNAKYR